MSQVIDSDETIVSEVKTSEVSNDEECKEYWDITYACGCIEHVYLSWYYYVESGTNRRTLSARPSRGSNGFDYCEKHKP